MGIELKFYDQKLVASALTGPSDASGGEHDPSATVLLNTVVQGDGESNRDGREIRMRSIMIEGNISVAPTATQSTAKSPCEIFIALVLDKQTNGATINSEDVFTNPGASATTASSPFRNLQQQKRFRVLATRKFAMANPNMANETGATGGTIVMGMTQRFRIFKSLGNLSVTYTGTTETVANISDNSLHIIAYCSSTSLVPKINYNSRLRFVG